MTDRDFPDETLTTVRALFESLSSNALRYCHWKSTASLPRALAGRTDLDLLVDRADAVRFGLLVRGLGFKPFISHPSRRFPSVEDFLGYDPESGRLVHLHVYYRLIVGEEHVKNHLLPLEAAFLGDAIVRHGVRVPPPHLELLVLIIRVLLKYRDTDAVKDALRLGKRGGIPPDSRAELRALIHETSLADLKEARRRLLPGVPEGILTDFLSVVERDPRDAIALLRLRLRLRRALRPYQRIPSSVAYRRYIAAKFVRLPVIRGFLHNSRSALRRKSPLAGGLTVAVLGSDGAGKSTVVAELNDWLAWRLNLRVAYLGTAQPSRSTAALQAASRLARGASGRLRWGMPGRSLEKATNILLATRYLAEARDRATRVDEGMRLAANGAIVIFDRYPLRDVRLSERSMDGPRIRSLGEGTTKGLLGLARKREESVYRRLRHPDLILLLSVPPEVALARKPSSRPATIVEKANAIRDAGERLRGSNVVTIDAAQPLPDVLARVKSEIWARL